MPLVPLFGHTELQERLRTATLRGSLPASLVLQGPRGIGKQRLALWLAQVILCERPDLAPCGECRHCRFVTALQHPDLHWYFPRSRLKDPNDIDAVKDDYAEAIAERAGDDGLYEAASGMDGIFIGTTRVIVQQAVLSPALGRRKVFIIGDAERMVPQEGREDAANAFLKLLEEPPADTTIILTSSEPGALLPTIRSRVVSFRAAPVDDAAMRAFVSTPAVQARLKKIDDVPAGTDERIAFAGGAPGRLLSGESWALARSTAERFIAAATGSRLDAFQTTWTQASSKARGNFADALDALTVQLHERAHASARRGATREALAASRAVELVEEAKERITTNVNPQLLTFNLIRDLQELFK